VQKLEAKYVWIVFKKEVKDIIRDKRTIFTSILLPMLLIPLINVIMGGGVQNFTKGINENVTIALSGSSNTTEIQKLVKDKIIISNPEIKLIEVKDSKEAITKEEVRCVLDFEKDYAEKLKSGKPFTITLLYDKSKMKSESSVGIVSNAIDSFNAGIVKDRIKAMGENPDLLLPAKIEETDVSKNRQSGNTILMMTLPLMLGMLVAMGGIPAATDLVAGEKERNTLEPLLTTKPGRASLLMGKYLTVTLFSLVSVAAITAGMVIGYVINPDSLTMGTGEQISGFNIPLLAALLTLAVTVALGMTFSGIQIALSTYARSFKEAQTYMSFLLIIAILPGYATMFMQPSDIAPYMFLLPVINTIACLKIILGDAINYSYLLMALISSVIYVVLTLWLAAHMFKKEKLLFRS